MLKREELQPLSQCGGKYGAPMGRAGGNGDSSYAGLVYLEPILDPCPNACGAYDYGGAYWGGGRMVWRAIPAEDDLEETYFRGASSLDCRESIIDAARKESGFDGATFEVLAEPLGGCAADDGLPCDYCLEMETEEESE